MRNGIEWNHLNFAAHFLFFQAPTSCTIPLLNKLANRVPSVLRALSFSAEMGKNEHLLGSLFIADSPITQGGEGVRGREEGSKFNAISKLCWKITVQLHVAILA